MDSTIRKKSINLSKIFIFVVFCVALISGTILLYRGDMLSIFNEKIKELQYDSKQHRKEPKHWVLGKVKNGATLQKNKVLLVVGVLNKLSGAKRRNSIRLTWFRQCKQNPNIVQCRFFTDQIIDTSKKINYEHENEENGKDMLFMPIKGGHAFAQRLLWMMRWFSENFKFDYMLRVDDDYFLCMNRLLMELPHRPKTGLYWGWIHCFDNIIRVDEGWMILTKDIIEEALGKYNTSLLCHPFGDQAVPLWIRDSKLPITWFLDNERVIHKATTYESQTYMVEDLCQKYLALHGTYKDQMLKYWNVSKGKVVSLNLTDATKNKYNVPVIPKFSDVCKANMNFKTSAFGPGYRFEPKLCKDNPTWSVTDKDFIGRENIGRDTI